MHRILLPLAFAASERKTHHEQMATKLHLAKNKLPGRISRTGEDREDCSNASSTGSGRDTSQG
eukprot:2039444-Karenia_brevis.AAC.1